MTFSDGTNNRHVVAEMTPAERQRAVSTATAFATVDVPALTSGAMRPTFEIRYPGTLSTLSYVISGGQREPQASDVAAFLDRSFDSVFVIWKSRGTDLNTGQQYVLNGYGGFTWGNGLAQTYSEFSVDSTASPSGLPGQNVFKHEWGHAIASYYDAAGTAPKPSVDNHQVDSYVNCMSGSGYVLMDETQENPIPNSVYNNTSGFTHDFYSGTTKLRGTSPCLGITPAAWASGGPVTGPNGPRMNVASAAEAEATEPIPATRSQP
ncbi:MAG: hypothetical protein HYX51_06965 [Chloroflexi bacterium]|nr:hypothetical protein [Chloroflexota bacterium]